MPGPAARDAGRQPGNFFSFLTAGRKGLELSHASAPSSPRYRRSEPGGPAAAETVCRREHTRAEGTPGGAQKVVLQQTNKTGCPRRFRNPPRFLACGGPRRQTLPHHSQSTSTPNFVIEIDGLQHVSNLKWGKFSDK